MATIDRTNDANGCSCAGDGGVGRTADRRTEASDFSNEALSAVFVALVESVLGFMKANKLKVGVAAER